MPREDGELKKLNLEWSFDRGVDILRRIIRLEGEVGEDIKFTHLDAALTEMEQRSSRKTITIKINSGGGYVVDAQAIIARIKASPCHIVTEGYGQIESSATLIFASGDRRRISRFCRLMVHEASYQIGGKHSEIANYVKQTTFEEDLWATWYYELTGYKTPIFWRKMMKGADNYFDAHKALEYQLADEVF